MDFREIDHYMECPSKDHFLPQFSIAEFSLKGNTKLKNQFDLNRKIKSLKVTGNSADTHGNIFSEPGLE